MTSYDLYFTMAAADISARPFSFGFEAAVAVRGVRKLANRFTKCLLTPKGTDSYDLEYGTDFATLASYNFIDASDVMDAVTLFVDDASTQLRVFDQRSALSPDERLASATIASATETADGVMVVVNIRSVAGTVVPAPLPTIPLRR